MPTLQPRHAANFYPHSPCGERPILGNPCAGCPAFLSTLSLRRATVGQKRLRQKLAISIHTLLAESDVFITIITICTVLFLSTLSLRRATISHLIPSSGTLHFYPHSPCGERPPVRDIIQWEGIFLSTLSLRRATVGAVGQLQCIHDFYPHSPCGERLILHMARLMELLFLSTLSLRRATT